MNIDLDTGRFAVTLRFGMVAALAVLLLIPLLLVSTVVDDRQQYYRQAVANIGSPWGGRQRLLGPVVLIPFAEWDPAAGRRPYVAAMPAQLRLRVDARHETRSRGLFDAPVLTLDVAAEGSFAPLARQDLRRRFGQLRFDQAAIAVGVSDTRGIRSASFVWDGAELPLVADASPYFPGLRGDLGPRLAAGGPRAGARFRPAGVPAPEAAKGEVPFKLTLRLRASERVSVVPVGDQSETVFVSSWPHPSFDGRFLPDDYALDSEGFRATWTTLHLARGFPSLVQLDASGDGFFADKDLGFSVFEPVSLYGSVSRSVKYGVLFVVLTLVSVLCLELATGRRFHFVQYGVGGLALVLFFLVLLALAEHVGFAIGYALAAALLATMVGAYAYGSTGDRRLGLTAGALLAVLYAVLYGLLRLESYALLAGAGVLLAALAMLMRTTRGLTPAPRPTPAAE